MALTDEDRERARGFTPTTRPAPAPATAAPAPAGFMPSTRAVLRGAGEDASAAINRGQYAQAAGSSVRGFAALVPAVANDVIGRPAGEALDAAKGFYTGLTGGTSDPAPAPAASPRAGAPAPSPNRQALQPGVAAPAGAPATPSTTAAAAPATTGVMGAPGVTKVTGPDGGVTYTNVPGAGFQPGGVSARNMAAANALDARYRADAAGAAAAGAVAAGNPTGESQMAVVPVGALGFRPASEEASLPFDARGLSQREIARLSTQLATNAANNATSRANVDVQAGVQARGQDLQAGLGTARLGFDREQASRTRPLMEAQTAEAENRVQAQQMLMAAQQAYQQALASRDPMAVQRAEDQLRAAQGRWERMPSPPRMLVVPGGQDETGKTQPSRVFDPDTRQWIEPPQQGAGSAQPLPAREQLKAGTVYQTARGPARWDGSKFIPAQ